MLASRPSSEREKFLASLTDAEIVALDYDWPFWARPKQIAPDPDECGPWMVWAIIAGRGGGKTRTGAEWINGLVQGDTPLGKGRLRQVMLVARNPSDARDVMIESRGGLKAVAPPGFRPDYNVSRKMLTWPNGAIGYVRSADDPESLRGPEFEAAWSDEFGKWRYQTLAWDNLQFGLRLGPAPQQIITTTPRPTEQLRRILEDKDTIVTRWATWENAANLSPAALAYLKRRYEGTRTGRQELEGEMLDDTPGALWSRAALDKFRIRTPAERKRVLEGLGRRVVAIDPPTTSGEDADECGIVVAGLGADGHGYVIEDRSEQGLTPREWAERAVAAYHEFRCDRIVAETNQGGEMVGTIIRQIDPHAAYRAVHTWQGKHLRAEPVSALYEQGRVHHLGTFPELEDQMCVFTADYDRARMGSPDRLDACVYALTDLMLQGAGTPRITLL